MKATSCLTYTAMAFCVTALTGPAFAAGTEDTGAARTIQVFFPLNSVELDDAARQEIARIADDWEREAGSGPVSVIGHSDTSGPADYNLQLSERRAQAVEDLLLLEGIPSEQIITVARGEDDLLESTSDGVPEDDNRRVEIVLPAPPPPPVQESADVAPPPQPAPAPAAPAPVSEPESDAFTFALGPVYGYNYGENDNGADNNLFGLELTFRALPGFLGGVSLSQMGLWSYNGIDDGLTGRTVASLDLAPDFGIFRPTLALNGGLVYGEAVQDGFVVGPELRFDVVPIAGFNIGLKVAYDYQFDAEDLDKGILWGGLDLGLRF